MLLRDVSDKEAMQVSRKEIAEEALKYINIMIM
jgi:hypothetical protein